MTEQLLLQQQEQVQTRMSALLLKIREENGIKNPFIVSKELGQSTSTLRNIEKGIAFPTVKTLNDLIKTYSMTLGERMEVLDLKEQMLRIRRELKTLRASKASNQ
jgi:transcriptional regulator with XRE-family HTH domain